MMARPPVGTVAQSESRTALFAYVACRLAGVAVADQAAFYATVLRVKIGRTSAEEAAKRRRHEQPGRRRRGPASADPPAPVLPENAALRGWLLVEEHKLNLSTAMIRFPGAGARQGELLRDLARVRGVRQLFELSERADVIAIVIYDGEEDRQRLRAELGELVDSMIWEGVESESHSPAADTWQHLAQRAASSEDLLA